MPDARSNQTTNNKAFPLPSLDLTKPQYRYTNLPFVSQKVTSNDYEMGNGSSCPLQDYSTSDLVEQMLSNGTGFQQYEAAVRASGMNGEVLAELDEEGFLKALDSANITLRLHRRKLLQQFKRAPIRKLNRRRSSRRRSSARLQHRRSSSSSVEKTVCH